MDINGLFSGSPGNSAFPFLLKGKWRSGENRRTYFPFSGLLPVPGGKDVWSVDQAERTDLEEALRDAGNTRRIMRDLPRFRRSRILENVSRLLEEHREPLAKLIVQEVGKPLSAARFEVDRAATTFRTAAHAAADFGTSWMPGDSVPQGIGMNGLVERIPKGFVLAVTPYNFPLNLLAHKVAPAIAAGCPLLVKPAPFGSLTALMLGALLLEAGLPPDALSILPADIPGTLSLVEHPEVDVVSFTGSDVVGWSLRDRVPRKTVVLELGGNAGVLVTKDAEMDGLPEKLVSGAFAYAGQVCISVQRVLVHRSLFDRLVSGMVGRVEHLEKEGFIGDPGRDGVLMGPLIQESHAEKVWGRVQRAVQEGATALTPLRREGTLIHPVILTNTKESDEVESEEIFGPVVTVIPFDRTKEAIDRLNRSKYGLQAGIFTKNLEEGLGLAGNIDCPGVFVNEIPTFRLDHWPYGGIRHSGSGTEGVVYAMEEMTRPRLTGFRTRRQESELR
ncbi:aldehyde dehydrogenase family protein [Leptospirillum ferriphilum]|uniref:aldehyde dehydrogenase family protein n=1 Tax=Leptospirillum ferriphilum TaxID=178606 RepID=UPI0006B20C2D|nr:aldehyde dehydrogenase family protein [Leptospirillum ferriphilum]